MPMLRMAVSALIALSLDLFSEVVIIHWLDLPSVHTIHVWPPYLNLVMAWNTGIDFGLMSNYGGRWLLVAFPIAVSLGLTAWVRTSAAGSCRWRPAPSSAVRLATPSIA